MNRDKFPQDKKQQKNPFHGQGNKPQWSGQNPSHNPGQNPGQNPNKPEIPSHKDKH